jgi:hypothetical protein
MAEHDENFERTNVKIGLALFGLFVVLLGLAFAVGFIYLAVF